MPTQILGAPGPNNSAPSWLRSRALWLVVVAVLAGVGGATWLFATAVPAPQRTPVVIWSVPDLAFTLSPGESASRTLTLTSSQTIRNVRLEGVPAIAPFLSIQPSQFSTLRANQPQTVQISILIPPAAALGDYSGTIHVRSGSSTLPQTLKLRVRIWQLLRDQLRGLSMKYPQGWQTSVVPDGYVIEAPSTVDGGRITVLFSMDVVLPLEEWIQHFYGDDLQLPFVWTTRRTTPGGLSIVELNDLPDESGDTRIAVFKYGTVIVRIGASPVSTFESDFGEVLNSVLLH